MFPPILTKYGVAPDPMDFGQTFADLYKAVWKLDEDIKAATESADKGEKVIHPWNVKANSDKQAKKVAEQLVKDFLTAADAAIGKSANVAHFLAEMDGNISAYFTSEVQYYRHKHGDPKPQASTDDSAKADRKELVEFARKLWDTFPTLANEDKVKAVVKYEDGKLSLPSIRGRASQTGESDIPTGRYAQHYRTVWNVDGETFPVGTDPRDILRAVYVGTERVGKKLGTDLFDLLDKAKPKDYKMGDPFDAEINGHKVSVSYPAAE